MGKHDAPVYDTRLPRQGILRKYMLLPEYKKAGIIGIGSIGIVLLLSWLFTSGSNSIDVPMVQHSFSSAEKKQLREQIRAEERAKFESLLVEEEDTLSREIEELDSQLLKEWDSETLDRNRIAELENQLAMKQKEQTALTENTAKKREEFESGLDSIVSSRLVEKQAELIRDGANELLNWFCTYGYETSSDIYVPQSVSEAQEKYDDVTVKSVDLDDHPCVGVANDEDGAHMLSMHMSHSSDKARTVAQEALSSLAQRDENLVQHSIAQAAYDPSSSAFCPECSMFMFATHPVFGVFYKMKLALQDKKSVSSSHAAQVLEQESDSDIVTRNVCFRRRWVAKPVVTPLSYSSQILHLLRPELLPQMKPVSSSSGSTESNERSLVHQPFSSRHANEGKQTSHVRALEDDKKSATGNAKNIVHFILPFRASNIDSFPELVKSLEVADRVRRNGEASKQPLLRLLIAPLEGELQASDKFKVEDRLGQAIEAANKSIHYNITMVPLLPQEKMTTQNIISITKTWIANAVKSRKEQAEKVATKSVEEYEDELIAIRHGKEKSIHGKSTSAKRAVRSLSDFSNSRHLEETTSSSMLKNRWLSAVLSALMYVPYSRTPVFILDSSTNHVSASMAKKTLWRIIEDNQIISPIMFSPASYAVDNYFDIESSNGGISVPDADLNEEPGTKSSELPFRLPEFYVPEETYNPGRRLRDGHIHTSKHIHQGRRLDILKSSNGRKLDDSGILGNKPDFNVDNFNSKKLDDDVKAQNDFLGDFGYGLGLDDDYEGFDGTHSEDDDEPPIPITEAQYNRMTAFGAAKVDLAFAIYKLFAQEKQKSQRSLQEEIKEFGDECIVRRLLTIFHENSYMIVRAPRGGLRIPTETQQSPDSTISSSPELSPCECETSQKEKFCRLSIPITQVDDVNDKERVLCAIAQMRATVEKIRRQKQQKNKDTTKTPTPDTSKSDTTAQQSFHPAEDDLALQFSSYDYPHAVDVHHPVRYFDPAEGLTIVGKITAKLEGAAKDAPALLPTTAEVFSFRWEFSDAVVEFGYDDTNI